MCRNVSHKEREKKPARSITVKLAGFPQMVDLYLGGKCVFGVEDEDDKEEINDVADDTP